ncbi:hypothetical protein T07_9942 [Trichinella nelsoni]|uniref:Uncharacterized protein n=1 Tax=Trichinella nelsoni TaxID=6336 RepID=A0A0V0RSG3_9BILA|nr:hypothetical protein T07_10099 [Trichinella nelsoni]KRX26201.1 hypothetical protein T07_9942 [Trichinella nelsoni]
MENANSSAYTTIVVVVVVVRMQKFGGNNDYSRREAKWNERMIQNVINDPDECWLARVELFGTLGNKLLFFRWKKLCLLRAVRGRQFGPILVPTGAI